MFSLAALRIFSFSCVSGAATLSRHAWGPGDRCTTASPHSDRTHALVRAGAREDAAAAAAKEKQDEEEEGKPRVLSIARLGSQALICLLTLGFLDAGYSGDWSRIGVLSKEVESSLRIGAYGVVPLALLLLWFISTSNKKS